jgi:sterol desaturase/sphingolipid hydroxylase (fatty acid hydroxylase superfamily)
MTAWLLAHQASVQFAFLLGAFAAVALWESFRPRRKLATPTPARWIDNLALAAIGSALTRASLPLVGVGFALFAEQRGLGLFNVIAAPAWLAFVLAVILLDFAQYGLHRLVHAVPMLWRIHKIHHAELDVDCVTAIRHHPLEMLFVAGVELLAIGLLGAPPLAVLAVAILNVVTSVFNHGNVGLTPPIDRALRLCVVTPDMHRVHHSVENDECNANFSMVFSWWDRWFGTWCEAPRLGHERASTGLAEARDPDDISLLRSLLMPFRRGAAPIAARSSAGR